MATFEKQVTKAKLLSLYEKTIKTDAVIIIKKGRIKIIKKRKNKMINFLYNTAVKRIAMRFLEIFIVAGTIGVLSSPELQSLLPPLAIGVVAAILKAIREWWSKRKFEEEHEEMADSQTP